MLPVRFNIERSSVQYSKAVSVCSGWPRKTQEDCKVFSVPLMVSLSNHLFMVSLSLMVSLSNHLSFQGRPSTGSG